MNKRPKLKLATLYILSVLIFIIMPGISYAQDTAPPCETPWLEQIDPGMSATGYLATRTCGQSVSATALTLTCGPDSNWSGEWGSYIFSDPAAPCAVLTPTILPETFEQGRWSLSGPVSMSNKQSGESTGFLPPGEYTLSFQAVTGFNTPPPITFNLDFEYFLIYTAGAGGTIDGQPSQRVVENGDGSAVEALPDSGYSFVEWCDGSTDNPRTDMGVSGDMSVTAEFELIEYILTYTAGANGSISGQASQRVVENGDGSAVEALPDSGYSFVQWSDGVTDNPRTDAGVTSDLSVAANFEEKTYFVSCSTGNGSGSTGGGCGTTVGHGDSATVTASPSSGYDFSHWSGDASGTSTSHTFSNVTSNKSATANFVIQAEVVRNSRTGKDCHDICASIGKSCVSVGTNSEATDGKRHMVGNPSWGSTQCLHASAHCGRVMLNKNPWICGNRGADWTNCRCQ